jgi:hypothetical protein
MRIELCKLREMRPLAVVVVAAGSSRVAVFAVAVLMMMMVYNPGRKSCLYIQFIDLCIVMFG